MLSQQERRRIAKEKLAAIKAEAKLAAEERLAAKEEFARRKEERRAERLSKQTEAEANKASAPEENVAGETNAESAAKAGVTRAAPLNRTGDKLKEATREAKKVEQAGTKDGTNTRKRALDKTKVKAKRGKRMKYTHVPLVPTSVPETLDAEAYREAHNIMCKNMDCPPPLQTFEAAEPFVGAHFVKMLRDRDFLAPSPIQAQAWPLALGGHDIVAIAQTGSGKTLAYLLPALVRLRDRGEPSTASQPATPSVLVLAPTRELIQQIASDVAHLAISIGRRFVPCFGGVGKVPQLRQLDKGCDILLSTPGRLKDFMQGDSKKGAAPAADCSKVSYLVLDEADAMIAMGFMKQVRDIVRACLKTGTPAQGGGAAGPNAGVARQTLFFTATWPHRVTSAAAELTGSGAVQLRIGQGVGEDKLTANQNVRQVVQLVAPKDKLPRLENVLTSELKQGDTCLVFCSTKNRTDFVVASLRKSRIVDWCDGIHSGKEQWVRDKILQKFRTHTANGDRRAVLVATDVAARGIDIPGVGLVVVYDLNGPNGELNTDYYVHRIGRTGRADKMGRAFTFVDRRDRGIPQLVKLLQGAGQRIPIPLQDVEIQERAPVEAEDGKARRKVKRKVKKRT